MEKAVLVGLSLPSNRLAEVKVSLVELSRLAETAGAVPEQTIIQQRKHIDPAYLIGCGKAEEIRDLVLEKGIHTVIFDDDLRPVQQKNLEDLIGSKIIDRTRLILDIFARRARTREGILQVERAQLEYYLPRLNQKGIMLDSQFGGIGARRGPGERKLEVDQRYIRDRISALDREISKIGKQRGILRQKRVDAGQPAVAIVGYTNAGKSTLLNTLSSAHPVYADDKLFATLDPTTRRVKLPNDRTILFTDTVGFINKLPHSLIAAFRATLEEVSNASCILHVIDASEPEYEKQAKTVYKVLKELGAEKIPTIPVYNKADLLSRDDAQRFSREGCILISAKGGEGVKELLTAIEEIVSPKLLKYKLLLPYSKSQHLAKIYAMAIVKNQSYTDKGIKLEIETAPQLWQKIQGKLK